jgi:AcrR family transcriptional regulator
VSTETEGSSSPIPALIKNTDLRAVLLEHAVALTRAGGPQKLSLREVQRRAGVSPAAAYRHYRDREALLIAVGERASATLADALARAAGGVAEEGRGDRARTAALRLRAVCRAYLDFAAAEPGLLRVLLLAGEDPEGRSGPAAPARGADGRGPYQVLQDCLRDLVTAGVLPEANARWSATAVSAATHGLAVFLFDGPLRHLDEGERQAATERHLDLILAGLARQAP